MSQHKKCLNGETFTDGTESYINYFSTAIECQSWCENQGVAIGRGCEWTYVTGKCRVINKCLVKISAEGIWSAACSPAQIRYNPLQAIVGPQVVHFTFVAQSLGWAGLHTARVALYNERSQILSRDYSLFSETMIRISDCDVKLSSTALSATGVTGTVSFSMPGNFSRLTSGRIVLHFPFIYESIGDTVEILRGTIQATAVTASGGNAAALSLGFSGSLNPHAKIQFILHGITNPAEAGIISDSKLFIYENEENVVTSQTYGISFSSPFTLIENAKVVLGDATVLSTTKAIVSFTLPSDVQVPRGNSTGPGSISYQIPTGYGGIAAVATLIHPTTGISISSVGVVGNEVQLQMVEGSVLNPGANVIFEVEVINPGITLQWLDASVSVNDAEGLITRQIVGVDHSVTRLFITDVVVTLQDRSTSTITKAFVEFTIPMPYALKRGECIDVVFPDGFSLSDAPITIDVSKPFIGTNEPNVVEGRSVIWCIPVTSASEYEPGTIIKFEVDGIKTPSQYGIPDGTAVYTRTSSGEVLSKQISNIAFPSISAPMSEVFARLHDYSIVSERDVKVTIGMTTSVDVPSNGMIRVKFLAGVGEIINPRLRVNKPVFDESTVISDIAYTNGLGDDVPSATWRIPPNTFISSGTYIEFDLKSLKDISEGWPIIQFLVL